MNGSDDEVDSSKNQLAEFTERGKFIPLRLTFGERKLLRLCEAALNVSERGVQFAEFEGSFCNHYSVASQSQYQCYIYFRCTFPILAKIKILHFEGFLMKI